MSSRDDSVFPALSENCRNWLFRRAARLYRSESKVPICDPKTLLSFLVTLCDLGVVVICDQLMGTQGLGTK